MATMAGIAVMSIASWINRPIRFSHAKPNIRNESVTKQEPYYLHVQGGTAHDPDAASYTWKPLEFLNVYRFLISVFFTALFYTDLLFFPLARMNKALFFNTSVSYLGLSILFAFMLRSRKPGFRVQVSLQLFTDITATILLMHFSGGVNSGVGNLLIITVAGGSVVLSSRDALMFASLATFALLGEQFYTEYSQLSRGSTYTQAGLLGLTLFVTAVVAHLFAKRIRESEALAKERGVDLANMAELTERIIQRMQTGIVVIDGAAQIRLINESAWYMLGMPSIAGRPALHEISPELTTQFAKWKRDPETTPETVQSSAGTRIMPRFAHLSKEENPATLIFLEDTAAMTQQAQQLQLASLGRLTASIAHEIRNPLGAISHAGQLLAESPDIDQHDTRLTRIIQDQSRRMNTIIESVMQLGRRNHTQPQLIKLHNFLEKFVNDFLAGHHEQREAISINVEPDDVQVRFDPTHLQQIITNLTDNALRHSLDFTGNPKVELQGGLSLDMNRPYLDVIDHGAGIDSDTAEHIFEPFFTTSTNGSGLGLYISRALAECNQATLNYLPMTTGGSCFRLSFQDPRRQMH
jgi:two-component system sensor histidine kinase PilS (NtrC family)